MSYETLDELLPKVWRSSMEAVSNPAMLAAMRAEMGGVEPPRLKLQVEHVGMGQALNGGANHGLPNNKNNGHSR